MLEHRDALLLLLLQLQLLLQLLLLLLQLMLLLVKLLLLLLLLLMLELLLPVQQLANYTRLLLRAGHGAGVAAPVGAGGTEPESASGLLSHDELRTNTNTL